MNNYSIPKGLHLFNRLLLGGTFLLFFLLVYRAVRPPHFIPTPPSLPTRGEGKTLERFSVSHKFGKSFSRNIFRPLVAPPAAPKAWESTPVSKITPPPIPLAVLAESYRLVGILAGPPRRAIVEDSVSGKTLTLTTGQPLGPMSVQSIDLKKVTLERGGETVDLHL